MADREPAAFESHAHLDDPIRQSTKFKLVVDLKTAKALGLTIPESILLRAYEVIR